jgi:hypothetical protein
MKKKYFLILLFCNLILSDKSKIRKKSNRTSNVPYLDWENVVAKKSMLWGDFINAPIESLRNKMYIKQSVLNALSVCSPKINSNKTKCSDVNIDLYIFIAKK